MRSDTQRRPSSPSNTPGAFLGISIQVARSFLFIEPRKKAMALFAAISLLSLYASFVPFTVDDNYYWVQKHSIFNQYGVKLGWFWTCVLVGPFIWFASKAHNRDRDMPIVDVLRLVVATVLWYGCVGMFHKLLAATSRCDINVKLTRTQCSAQKGVWTPGIDISGHCFLMVYSLLIMSEEAVAFRNWNQLTQTATEGPVRAAHDRNTRIVQYFFVGMLVLSLFWLKQLVISVIYYHIWYDKVVGALVAVLCWALTYHFLYPMGLLQSPIHRKKKPTATTQQQTTKRR